MDDEWISVRLEDVAEVLLGKMLDQKKNKGTFLPYLANTNVRWGEFDLADLRVMRFEAHEGDRYGLRHGDIVMCEGGEPGRCALWRDEKKDMMYQKALHRIRPYEGTDNRFLYYSLLHGGRTGAFAPFCTGTTIKHLPRQNLLRIQFKVPPLPTQHAIAHILGTLDDKIELNRKMNQTLEEMARAIFKSWFVDFDPVRAKAAGHQPPNLKPDIAALFPDSFEDSELGEIPKGWKVASFTDGIDVFGGGTPKTSRPDYWGGEIPWFSVVDTPANGEVFVISTEKSVTQAGIDNSSARVLPVGTTIISARGTVGNLALVGTPMAMNQSCYGLWDQRSLAGYFLYFATAAVVETLRQRGHGSVFNTITRDTLNGVRVVAPPNDLVNTFERVIGGSMSRLLANLHQSRTLSALRDALLPKLLSGELRVPDAERIAGRCM